MQVRLKNIGVSIITIVMMAACGGDGGLGYGVTPPGDESGDPATTNAVAVSDNQFTPSATQVAVGTTVKWTWSGNASAHNVTFADGAASATQGANATYSRTFGTVGVFNYHCTIHSGMNGSVTVK
jgi:plastocyanin